MPETDINPTAVDRLVERVSSTVPRAKVRSAFSGTRGLAPTMVAVVGALPAVVVVAVSLAIGRPLLLVLAALVMAATMVLIMTVVNTTVVVAELPGELALFTVSRSVLEPLGSVPKALQIAPGGSRSWLQVQVADQVLWVSRSAFGGIVERFVVEPPAADGASPPDSD